MKIITIGDIHGRSVWKEIVEKEKDADKIIFIGDYFDSFDIPSEDQFKNFNEIIEYKIAHPEQVVLLIGNHDYQYFWFTKEKYSGYQEKHAMDIRDVLNTLRKEGMLQIAYQHDRYLFTHAGVTKTWYTNNYPTDMQDFSNVANEINYIFEDHPEAFRFTPSTAFDQHGDSITQSPIWVRPRTLATDAIDRYIQVVGHTHMPMINNMISPNLWFIDTFDHCKEYLAIVDGKPETRTL